MPAEMIVASSPDTDSANFMIMPPNHAMAFEIDDPSRPTREILIVSCMKHDRGSDAFIIPEPDGYTDIEYMNDPEVIREFCTPDNFLTSLTKIPTCTWTCWIGMATRWSC